jgi:hypothetical protein
VIDYLNGTLVHLLTTNIPGLTASQIGFNIPDQDWRTMVSGMTTYALNIFLVEISENADLRSNERIHGARAGVVTAQQWPARVGCRYLISAWSPVKPTPLTSPSTDEAVILYRVLQVLMNESPLDPTAVYAPGPLPAGFPPELADPVLPTVVAPPDPFVKLPDFWMRMDGPWRPVVDLTVTVPVVLDTRPLGPPVTTLFTEYGTTATAELEERIAIGGVVRSGTSPVAGAWVRLAELDDTVSTNAAGQFLFTGLRRGTYTLQAGAPGHAMVARTIAVPILSGEYDLLLS